MSRAISKTALQEELHTIIHDPPVALMWKGSPTLNRPVFGKKNLFDRRQNPEKDKEFGFLEDFEAVLIQFTRDRISPSASEGTEQCARSSRARDLKPS